MSALPREHRGWAVEPFGTSTWSCSFRGIASTKAMSSLERLPQAQRSASAHALEAQRIIHPQRKLGVAEVLRLVDVVEEVVHPPAGELPLLQRRQGAEPRLRRVCAGGGLCAGLLARVRSRSSAPAATFPTRTSPSWRRFRGRSSSTSRCRTA